MKTEERFFCPDDENQSGSQVQFGVEKWRIPGKNTLLVKFLSCNIS